MRIDLHIHSKEGSDGRWSVEEIFKEAKKRDISYISITDHDSIDAQCKAKELSLRYNMGYIYGIELNITFSHPRYPEESPISLDLLAYEYDLRDVSLNQALNRLKDYRKKRALEIIERLNYELKKENRAPLTEDDINNIESQVNGSFGRPHIANYLVKKGIVQDKEEAFQRYLHKCNVPKMPLSLEEASQLVRNAGGKVFFAHPSDPQGTSLIRFSNSIYDHIKIIEDSMLPYLDGIECFHSRHEREISLIYLEFVKKKGLMFSGGSDCHQDPVIMGTVEVPEEVIGFFNF